MVIAYAQIHLRLAGCRSLKEKRQALRSIMDRARRMGVSISEVADHDLWNAATLGVSCTSNQAVHASSIIQQVIMLVESFPEIEVAGLDSDVIHVD